MTILLNTLKAGSHGAAVDAASTLAGGQKLTVVGSSVATVTWDRNVGVDTDGSAKFGAVEAGKSRGLFLPTTEPVTSATGSVFVRLAALPTGGNHVAATLSTASTAAVQAVIAPSGGLTFKQGNGTAIGSVSTTKMQPDRWYRIDLAFKQGAAGKSLMAGQLCDPYSTTPIHSASTTTVDTSTKAVNGLQAGAVTAQTSATTGEFWIDQMRLETGTTTWPGAFVPPPAATTVDQAIRILVGNINTSNTRRDARIAAIEAQGGGTTTGLTTADIDKLMGF